MQDKSALCLDGAAHMHPQTGNIVHVHIAEPVKHIVKLQISGGFIDDQPHRAFVIMRADKDHRMIKPRIPHAGHRHQKLAGQIHFHAVVLMRHRNSMACAPAAFNPRDCNTS